MADAILDGTGSGYTVAVTPSNEMKVAVTSGAFDGFVLRYKQLMDYEGGNMPIYLGLASPGTSPGSPNWMIRKFIWSNNLFVSGLFGSGNTNFDKTWDNRSGTNEVYS